MYKIYLEDTFCTVINRGQCYCIIFYYFCLHTKMSFQKSPYKYSQRVGFVINSISPHRFHHKYNRCTEKQCYTYVVWRHLQAAAAAATDSRGMWNPLAEGGLHLMTFVLYVRTAFFYPLIHCFPQIQDIDVTEYCFLSCFNVSLQQLTLLIIMLYQEHYVSSHRSCHFVFTLLPSNTLIKFLMGLLKTVSYTHLDVYKRQGLFTSISI